MTREALLSDLRQRGVQFSAAGDRLHYRAPKGTLTPELRRALRDHKAELLPLLARGPGVCRRCGRPAAANLLYHCVACADALHAERPSLREADPEGYARAAAWLEAPRDEKARWLREAEQFLAGLDPDDPRRREGERLWREGLAAYEALCRALPEPSDGHCLDCGLPSPRSLTPCDGCSEGNGG